MPFSMFHISCEELQRHRATKLIKLVEELFKGLRLNHLVEPTIKVEISTTFSDVFERYMRIINPEGGGKRVYTFDALYFLEPMCWA